MLISRWPLAAGDVEFVVQVLIVLFVIVGWIIRRVAAVVGQAKPPAQPGAPRPKTISEQIGDFIREAQEMQKKQQQQSLPRDPQRPAARPPLAASGNKPASQRAKASPRPQAPPAAPPAPIKRAESVAEHVQHHISSAAEFRQRADHLMDEDMQRADQVREDRLRQVFQHRVGDLSETSSAGIAAVSTGAMASSAGGAVALPIGIVLTPDVVRQAFIVQLLLERPLDRWD